MAIDLPASIRSSVARAPRRRAGARPLLEVIGGAATSGRRRGGRPTDTVTPPAPRIRLEPPGALATAVVEAWERLNGGPLPARLALWDGSVAGDPTAPATITLRGPDALRHMLWAPGELGMARAYVAGDLEATGDVTALVAVLKRRRRPEHPLEAVRVLPAVWRAARAAGALGPPLPPPPEEARPRGRRHSPTRDAAAVAHHYDVGNDFYRLLLGPSMTYSCARWADGTDLAPDEDPAAGLARAQEAKAELVCRKLGLHEAPGRRLLDVGCGWGTLAIHAARTHGAPVVAITISVEQAHVARMRVREAGLDDLVEVRLQDYRDLGEERFDAIASVGMFEHVGHAQQARYLEILATRLAPRGRLLNHAISKPGGSRLGTRSFPGRYVFPDGELIDVGEVVLAMEHAGLEVRDVESLREHYARTLRAWVANLDHRWEEAVRLVGAGRARVWRLYLAGSIVGFEDGGLSIHQVLAVRPDAEGRSGMPPTRRAWDG